MAPRMARGQGADGLAVLGAAVLLAAAVSAAVSAAMMRYATPHPSRIASVRLGEMTAEYTLAVAAAEDAASPETAAVEARAWAAALEGALWRVSNRRGAVLLPARAVAAGAPDVTEEVRSTLKQILVQADAVDMPVSEQAPPAGGDAAVTARRCNRALAGFALLAAVWLLVVSRVHVNASWSDPAWGYLALPLIGGPGLGEKVLFEPPDALGSRVPYLKTVIGLPGDRIQVGADRVVSVNGRTAGRGQDARPSMGGRCRRSNPASCRRGITTCTAITWTAMTAATPKSVSVPRFAHHRAGCAASRSALARPRGAVGRGNFA